MHKIDGAGNIGGEFVDEDETTNRPPTVVTPEWLNTVQRELLSVSQAGGLAPDVSDDSQVAKAIKRLFGGNVRTIAAAGPTALTADDAGLVQIDAMAGNVSITLPAVNVVANAPLVFKFVRLDSSTNTVTVSCAGANTLVGGGSNFTLLNQGDHRCLTGDAVAAWATTAMSPGASSYKVPVRLATTANIANLAGGAPNTLDGKALAATNRILVKDQDIGSQNALYVVTNLGTGANGTWTRASDADQPGEISPSMVVAVQEGTANADTEWMLTTDGPITIGTTALVFAKQGDTGYRQLLTGSAVCVSNAMTITVDPGTMDFRSPTLTSGGKNRRVWGSAISMVIPSGALMGGLAGQNNRLIALVIDATSLGGGIEVAAVPQSTAALLDEQGVISTEAISTAAAVSASIASNGLMTVSAVISGAITVGQQLVGAGVPAGTRVVSFGTGTGGTGTYNTDCTAAVGATTITGSAGYAFYSTIARANVPYRLALGIDNTQVAAGVYAAPPTLVQPVGGAALAALASFGTGQVWRNMTSARALGTTYYNTTGKTIFVSVLSTGGASTYAALTVNGFVISSNGNYNAGGGITNCAQGMVPPGGAYSGGGVGLTSWFEYRQG